MGSIVEINDTLQITREQGFPKELDLNRHLEQPYKSEDFEGDEFTFKGKSEIRIYKSPPVRVFLVENRDGKWIYWGLVHILSIEHDYIERKTSGRFRIIYIYPPEEMKIAHKLIDRNEETDYFKVIE